MPSDRQPKVLLLQGPPSRFFGRLADTIEQVGGEAMRIIFCPGDWLYWLPRKATHYRGSYHLWQAFLDDFIVRNGITDIVYYADQFPYHRVAQQIARARGINAVSVEFGYLRPDWITLERDGMSAASCFPEDPERIRQLARQLPAADFTVRFPYTFFMEASNDVMFNLLNVFLRPLYPGFFSDRYYHPLIDYPCYAPRFAAAPRQRRIAGALLRELTAEQTPFFIVPLQMQSDYQLRANSPYRHQSEFIEQVTRSFAGSADPAARLVFKVHPLDNGLENWHRIVGKCARRHGIAKQVITIDGGNLHAFLKAAKGCVIINSTAGIHALRLGCPLAVLGIAVFDIAGLTHRRPLDEFWQTPDQPDPQLCKDLCRALAGTIQVKGNFYTRAGQQAAVNEIAKRILEGRINAPADDIVQPPRLERARALGLPVANPGEATCQASVAPGR
jgi:capsular polysaccharide export protein